MAASSLLLSFQVDPKLLKNTADRAVIQKIFHSKLHDYGLSAVHQEAPPDGDFLLTYRSSVNRSFATVYCVPEGLLTLDLHQYSPQGGSTTFSTEEGKKLEKELKDSLKEACSKSKSLPRVIRGSAVDVYYPLVDGRLVEYDIDSIVYEADSPYQNIRIAHSPSYGNMLILDNDINLSESDVLYTNSLMQKGRHDYKGATVLILGGGDGGLLHEILKESPAMVTMVDIDEMVVTAARKYLRGICGDSLDNLSGDNYQVIIGDAVKYMQDAISTGRTFNFVIYDLTAVPITSEPVGDDWDFYRKTFTMGLEVLAPQGKFLTHANGKIAYKSIEMFEAEMSRLPIAVKWSKVEALVPSFCEVWVFYELQKVSEMDSKVQNGSVL